MSDSPCNGNSNGIVQLTSAEAEYAIERLQDLCRFETVSATAPASGAYVECAKFIVDQLKSLTVLTDIHLLPEAPDHSPVIVAKWKGADSTLPILLLNSHYDVVPADTSAWTVSPFDSVRKDGKVYGRGTQDMKCVCVQYVEALRKISLLYPTWQPERDIYLTFVPDEEVGGSGMAAFLESSLYKNLPNGIGLALDEGLASTTNTFDVFYGERLPWWVDVTATGPTGHGSRFIDNTAVEQLIDLANKALAFRTRQKHDLLGMADHENCTHAVVAAAKSKQNGGIGNGDSGNGKKKTLGDVTTVNITTLQAGVKAGDGFAINCVPPIAKCSLDIRISPHMPPSEMRALLDTWCRECSKAPEDGSQLTWKFSLDANNSEEHATTSTDKVSNPWYGVFCDTLQDMKCDISPQVFPAATDSRFLRALGIRALGFSPMRNTEILLHENDEYIPESTFLEGIGIYVGLLHTLGSFVEPTSKKRPRE